MKQQIKNPLKKTSNFIFQPLMVTEKKIKSWTVSSDFDSCRIDYWLKKNISFFTYPTLCKLLRKGTVRVNGRRAKNDTEEDRIFKS